MRWRTALFVAVVLFVFTLPPTSSGDARNAGSGSAQQYLNGWNLAAFPPGSTLADGTTLYTLQPGDSDYEVSASDQGTQDGYGYWVNFGFGSQSSLNLGAGTTQPYEVDAPAGQWVSIGDPSGTQPAQVNGADMVFVFRPSTGYHGTTALYPGQGALAYSSAGATIVVAPLAGQASTAPNLIGVPGQPQPGVSAAASASSGTVLSTPIGPLIDPSLVATVSIPPTPTPTTTTTVITTVGQSGLFIPNFGSTFGPDRCADGTLANSIDPAACFLHGGPASVNGPVFPTVSTRLVTGILIIDGAGTQITPTFSVTGAWTLGYSFDCSASNGGGFGVTVNGAGSFTPTNTGPVQRQGVSGAGSLDYGSGQFFMTTSTVPVCTWELRVQPGAGSEVLTP